MSGTPPKWYPDPSGRAELRYWDGSVWTDHVSNQGIQGVDSAAEAAASMRAREAESGQTPPAATPADDGDELDREAKVNAGHVQRIAGVLANNGLHATRLGPAPVFGSSGLTLAFAPNVIAVVTVPMFVGAQFSITYGIGKDLPQHRLEILDICNRHTQGLTAYPIHLHDADAGWDILLTLTYPIQLLLDQPSFITGFALNSGFVGIVAAIRGKFAKAGIPVTPYENNSEDQHRLQLRSLL